MNKFQCTGRLVKDHYIVGTTDKPILSNTIAIKQNFKGKNGEYGVDFIDFVIFGHNATYCKNYIKKGDMVAICGAISTSMYKNKEGQEVKQIKINVESIENMSFNNKTNSNVNNENFDNNEDNQNTNLGNVSDEDLPF
jgi:single-strand DNA-binding protein